MLRRRRGEGRHEAIQAGEPGMKEGPEPEVTVVGRGARLEGTVTTAGSLRIDGQVTGNIAAEGDVTLSSPSEVEAEIEGQNVVVAGKFKGNITARAKAELAQGGRVEGNIRSRVLVVSEGAAFSGQSFMDQEGPGEDAPAGTGGGEAGKQASPEQQEVDNAPGEAAEAEYSENELREGELRMAHEDAARRGADWFRSKLFGPRVEPDHNPAEIPGRTAMGEPVGPRPRNAAQELREETGPLRRRGGRRRETGADPGKRPAAVPRRWALSPFIVVVLVAGSLIWSLAWGVGLASDLGHARSQVRQLRAAEVELQIARSRVAFLRADIAGEERLLQEAQVCIGGLATSIERLVEFDTEEGLSWWRRTRPNCDRVMGLREA
jgi:cytoskeletal protein CcmA (bactofilin family)